MHKTGNSYQATLLPGMPRPEFGGVQLRPGFEAKRPYSGPMPLFEVARVDQDQPSLLDEIERGYLASQYGECADLIKER
jgi:hypothetical protein